VEKTPRAQSQAAGLTAVQQQELTQAKALAAKRLEEKLKAQARLADKQAKDKANRITIDQKSLDELVAARIAAQKQRKLEQSAKLISKALGQEIRSGSVDVETAGQKIIIRVREKASFGSGRAELKEGFRPILARVAEILKGTDGKIIVAGHTDNVPIYTERFRSNWELSAARAVSVAHEMMLATNIPDERFLIQGFADTEPVAKNDTPANRAKNRRVEIVLQQGDDKQSGDQISGEKAPSPAGRSLLPAAPAQGHTAVKPDKPGSTLGIRAGGHSPRGLL
jgi:chemotaxis protein MotB